MELILQQDDAAPDSMVEFNKQFESITGLTVFEFKLQAFKRDYGHTLKWSLNGFELSYSADNPFYELREKQTL